MPDKYKSVWVSHSSIGDFLKCPRSYFLRNVYKDPKSGKKIGMVSSAMSLGSAVHNTIEPLKNIPLEERLKHDLVADFEIAWKKISGKIGGFKTSEEEATAKERGLTMIKHVIKNPGPLFKKTVRLKEGQNGMPPNFFLSEEENIILCGYIDWLEYIEADDSVKIFDFKTGKHEETQDSLQLPIYLLLLNALQNRKVTGALYWYLDRDDEPVEKPLPDIEVAREKVLAIAKQIKKAREEKVFECPQGAQGCFACQPFEKILRGEAEYVGTGNFGQDMYIM